MPKDRKPDGGRSSGPGRPDSGRSAGARGTGKGAAGKGAPGKGGSSAAGRSGRTRPSANVVSPQRPWGLIAAAVLVVVFAAAVLTYAVVKVNDAHKDDVDSASDIAGVQTYDYANGQEHVTTSVDYSENPPVGGSHDGEWADCTGTVYDVDIRHENAVHSLEHGSVWITYNSDEVTSDEIATLSELVDGTPYRLMSPYAGLPAKISIQAWNHQLTVDSADDKRLKQFADFFTQNADNTPEPGASCENAAFAADPLVVGDPSRSATATATDAPSTGDASAASSAPASTEAETPETSTPSATTP